MVRGPHIRCLTLIALAGLLGLAACVPEPEPPEPPPTPTPSLPPPQTTPTPAIARKPLDAAVLFSGITYTSRLVTSQSDKLASEERVNPAAYVAEIKVRIQRPRASQSIEDFRKNDEKLAEILAAIPGFPEGADVSPAFEHLYDLKADWNRNRLSRLDRLVSRHNYYDCETILSFVSPESGRSLLLLKGDMDVNTDGSDGDRNVEVDDSSQFFQPQTSYRWRKQTERPNPFLAVATERLEELKAEYAIKGLTAERNAELKSGIEATSRRIYDLKTWSFLVSDTDPSIVLPGFMLRGDEAAAPYASLGDYAVVIYDGKAYPAIVGDAGPSYKFGEASMRLCRELNPRASAFSRPVSEINIAYLVFPGSADEPGPPDLDLWHRRCSELLAEFGLGDLPLHQWEDIVPAWPTPTPEPTPTPTPSPESTPPAADSPTTGPEDSAQNPETDEPGQASPPEPSDDDSAAPSGQDVSDGSSPGQDDPGSL